LPHRAEVRIEAALRVTTVVDATSDAPWAGEVRLRATATLVGTVRGAQPGEDISVTCPPDAATWPPATGLARALPRVRARIDAAGRFEIPDVPSQTPLTVWLGAGTETGGLVVGERIVLAAGERRALTCARPDAPAPRSGAASEAGPWIPVTPIALDAERRHRAAWFEIVPGGREGAHPLDGGRWHVHGKYPCDHLEAPPGTRTLVARSLAGWCGARTIQLPGDEPTPRVTVAPGGLLRIEAGAALPAGELRLRCGDVVLREREVLPGTLTYELVPAGVLRIERLPAGPTTEVYVRAGAIERVQI
jgi:hypothetical protein